MINTGNLKGNLQPGNGFRSPGCFLRHQKT